jgi:thiamine pyrophosphate-dependent acetolactate synthase large subunit-like protein
MSFAIGQALEILVARRRDTVVIATMTAGYLWPKYSSAELDFSYTVPMGSAGPLGLGLALAQPSRRVIVLDGDGSLLMNLGTLVTFGSVAPPNLVHVVCNNGAYSITGEQTIANGRPVDFAAIAASCGVAQTRRATDSYSWTQAVDDFVADEASWFVDLVAESDYVASDVPALVNSAQGMKSRARPGYHNLRQALS